MEPHLPFWQYIFFWIGIFALCSLIISLFIISRPKHRESISLSVPIRAQDQALIYTIASLTGASVVTGGNIELLTNGDEFYPALLKDIAAAKKSVNFTAYIWKPGTVSDQVIAALTQKASEGIPVRLLLDGFGAKTIPQKDLQAFKDAGGTVVWFHPTSPFRIGWTLKRNHARAIIIDDTIGYTGGMAVSDYWSGNATDPDHWRDSMFRLTGPQVQPIAATFRMLWTVSSGEVLVTPPPENVVPSPGKIQSVSVTNLAPDEDLELFTPFLVTSIAAAQHTIKIATPYLIVAKPIQQALIEAVDRGVEVTLLLPGQHIDSKIVQCGSQSLYKPLIEGGIEIYEYDPTMLHNKVITIDGAWSIIGSANIDMRSTYFNIENIIGVWDTEFAHTIEQSFNTDLAQAHRITADFWQHRSLTRRVTEQFCSLFNKQF
jgi:cardiolipin synthase A/B